MRKKLLIIFIILFVILVKLLLLPSELYTPKSYSKVIYDRNGQIMRIYLNDKEQFILPPGNKDEIPLKLKEAVLEFEDKNFYSHIGIDFSAIARAIYLNFKNKGIVSGGSTITMQTIRIFRGGERSYFNKLIEAIYALQLELKFDKDEILNLYLNHGPYGGNIEGYRSASLRYFNTIPEQLTWAQAATLAILPNAPSQLTGVKNRDKFLKKRNSLLEDLYKKGKLDKEDYELSLLEELPEKLYPIPSEAMFFTDFVRDKTDEFELHTTLDLAMQNKIEKLVKKYHREMEKKGVDNIAVLIADTETSEILSYVGGTYEDKNGGRIDALQVKRSSASTLKPFLYALSFDKGLISPISVLEDVPSFFQSFNPINSDRKYRGLVRADKALQMSLNIPMVKLLTSYGHHEFHKFLQDMKVKDLNTSDYYGLSMILGSIELTPYELLSFYTTLGNLGSYKPLSYLQGEKDESSLKLYSQGASYLTLDILSKVVRPDRAWENYGNQTEFYWKTGTSFGQRDAWAVGLNKEYTILVWLGNLDNSSSYKLTGIDGAAPFLFDILSVVSTGRGRIEIDYDSLDRIDVDKNGYRSNFGLDINSTYMPKDVVLQKDPYEKQIYVDSSGKVEVDSRTWSVGNYRSIIIDDYPSEVEYFLKLRGIETAGIKRLKDKNKLKFIYPKEGIKVKLPKGTDGVYEKLGIEVAEVEGASNYHWYLNGSYIMSTEESKIFIEVEEGENRIDLITDKQNSSSVRFWVD